MNFLLPLVVFFSSYFMRFEIVKAEPTPMAPSGTTTWVERIKSFAPNTVSYDLSSENTVVFLKDRPALATTNLGAPTNSQSAFFNFTNGFGLTRSPVKTTSGEIDCNWVPVFTVAFHNLKYTSSMAFLDETDFQVFRTSLGIGPELGYQYGNSRYSINLSPGVSYSWISYSSPASGGSVGRTNLNLALSLIYDYTFLNNITGRFYIRKIAEDTSVWKETLSSSQGFDIPVTRVISTVTGFSLLWRW